MFGQTAFQKSCRTLLLCAALLPAITSAATVFTLNETLPSDRNTFGYSVLPDGKHVLYVSDIETVRVRHLYLTDRRGGDSIRITPDMQPGAYGVSIWQLTADGKYVVYRVRQQSNNAEELYATDLSTRQSVRLSPTLVAGGNVSAFNLSADSRTVLFLADATLDNVSEMYAVRIDSAEPVRLSPTPAAGQYGYLQGISRDGGHALFGWRATTTGPIELYSAATNGSALHKLNGPLPAGGRTQDAEISADGSRVVFRATAKAANVPDLFSANLDGSDLKQISPDLQEPSQQGTLNFFPFYVTPDSQYVVYQSDHDVAGRFELFSVPIGGGEPQRVSAPRNEAWRSNALLIHRFTKDGQVIFRNDRDPDFKFHLYRAPWAGGDAVQLTHEYQGNRLSYTSIGGDEQTLLYRASETSDFTASSNLYAVPMQGGTVRQINPTYPLGRDVYDGRISPDNAWIVYHADQETDGVIELFRVPLTGGTPERINTPIGKTVGASRGATWMISPDSTAVFYTAEPIAFQGQIFAATLPVEVPLDIKPATCPNNVNLKSQGQLIVAMPGSDTVAIDDIDPTSIRLNGLAPHKVQQTDVASPYAPAFGKSTLDQCSAADADGNLDLQLHFDIPSLADTLTGVDSNSTVTLELMAKRPSGGSIIGDDVIRVQK